MLVRFLTTLWHRLNSRQWLPYRLSSQIIFLVGTSILFMALLVGVLFAVNSYQRSQAMVDEQMLFLTKNISSVSNALIITNDISSLEDLLKLNASFPYIESITIFNGKHRMLTRAVRKDDTVTISYTPVNATPDLFDQPLAIKTKPPKAGINWFSGEEQFELWHAIGDGKSIGFLRIEYSLQKLNSSIKNLFIEVVFYALLCSSTVLLIISLRLRAPMRALRDIADFATLSAVKSDRQLPIYMRTMEIYEIGRAMNKLSITVRSHQQNLADRMAQNQAILDNLIDGILVIGDDGIILSCNIAATRIFNFSDIEMCGENVSLLVPELLIDEPVTQLEPHEKFGQQQLLDVGREVKAQRKNGTIFPADLAISKCHDRGSVIFVGIIRDISERHRLDQLKSEFVATVSHELRTPLTSIHGSLKLVENGIVGELTPEAKKLIGLAQKNSSRLILLINDLLDMEKLTAGKMEIAIARMDLNAAVEQSISDNTGYATKFNVEYRLGVYPESRLVLGDAARVAQVLANILSNAAKFSGNATHVDVRIIEKENHTRVEIEDHGAGIPEDFKHKLFEAFSQANSGNTRAQGGTGLGLKISKALIEAMHGEIGFTSVDGLGSLFWFSLPNA